jgi:hypothetical protein
VAEDAGVDKSRKSRPVENEPRGRAPGRSRGQAALPDEAAGALFAVVEPEEDDPEEDDPDEDDPDEDDPEEADDESLVPDDDELSPEDDASFLAAPGEAADPFRESVR